MILTYRVERQVTNTDVRVIAISAFILWSSMKSRYSWLLITYLLTIYPMSKKTGHYSSIDNRFSKFTVGLSSKFAISCMLIKDLITRTSNVSLHYLVKHVCSKIDLISNSSDYKLVFLAQCYDAHFLNYAVRSLHLLHNVTTNLCHRE